MKSMFLGAMALACLAGAGGCGSPSCDDAAKHIVGIMAKEKPDMTDDKKTERIAKIAKRCEEKKPSADQMKCVMAASDMDAMDKCNKDK